MKAVKRRKLDHHAEQDESAKPSQVLDNHKKTFRVTRIPASHNRKTLQQSLIKTFCIGETSDLIIHSLVTDQCGDTSPQLRVATVTFKVLPKQLSCAEWEHSVSESSPNEWSIHLEDELPLPAKNVVLYFDTHFTGFTLLSSVEQDDKHVIDCVVIHGWGGHAFGSFKERGGQFMWLRDDIPSLFPQLRIWLYGYESKLTDETSIESVDDWCHTFCNLLVDLRAKTKTDQRKRPLIFIVHSLGGWIFKEAMVELSRRSDPKAKDTVKCTYGALFFGVPSQGMNVEALATMVGQKPQRATIALLDGRIHHRLRAKQHQEFCDAFNFKHSRIIKFFETSLSETVKLNTERNQWIQNGDRVLLVSPDSATSGRSWDRYEDHISLKGNHSTIVKFRPNDRTDYQQVRSKLRELVEEAEDAIRLRFASQSVHQSFSEEEYKCLQTLYHSDYNEHKSRNPVRTPGTCEWVLGHRHYLQWKDRKSSNLLWISADPGCGKSVLARFLIDRLGGSDAEHRNNLCFFFFKDDNDQQNSAILALRAILYQLFEAQKELIKYAIPHFKGKGAKFVEEIHTLWEILIGSTSDQIARETICIIDALDECNEQSRILFMNIVANFSKKHAGNDVNRPKLKVLITSRGYQDIELNLVRPDHPLTIRLRAEDEADSRSDDVKLFAESRVQEICLQKQISDETKRSLTKKVLENSDQTFLWASLILIEIEKSIRMSKKSLSNLIDHIPTSLNAVYERILNRTNDRESTRRLLHIIVGAVRPLSVTEMNVALFIKPEDRYHDDLDLEPVNTIENTIRNLCGLFVKIVDSKIYLIHQTARAFLITTDQLASSGSNLWRHSLNFIETERTLAEICVNYFMLKDFENPSYCNQSEHKGLGEENYLLKYVTANWASHFRKIQNEAGNRLVTLVRSIYDAKSARFDIWLQKHPFPWFFRRPSFTELSAASFFGHETITKLLLDKGADIEAKDNYERTALHLAAENGHEAVVKLLLEKGADAEAKDEYESTALHRAAENGHEAVVKLLLEKGADTEAKNRYESTALYLAAENGHEAVVKLLLEKGANIEAKDKYESTALNLAARNGHETVVKLLLEKGADAEAKDNYERTALHLAAENGHEAVVKLLLEKGANIEAKDEYESTALHRAAENGHEAVVKLLLEKGADTEAKDENETIALNRAAGNGHEAVVKLLLDKGADTEAKDEYESTALHRAAWNGHEAVIKLLLEEGADTEAKDKYGWTALYRAAWNGHEAVVKLLLDKGADTEAKDKCERTALHRAAWNGHEAVVKLLLEKGADTEAKDEYERTALNWAAGNGHEAVIKLLLEKGADTEAKNKYESTALHRAAENGHEAVVKLLLEKGADIEAKDRYERTALHRATSTNHEAVVKLLRSSLPLQGLQPPRPPP
ncbi:MAG: hypothetical protein M1814_006882 [Vezdaea aestivalis]|nr:MAG: hypothetical protein M1814_006882 [Vezdaea aestivalis]